MAVNAFAAYQQNKITTAAPAELTLMLYEGAIKFCNIALVGLEEKDYAKASNNIIKTENIINYLRGTLDFKYEIAKDFNDIYHYLYDLLVKANLKKDKAILEEVLVELRDLRDRWKEIMKKR